MQFTPCVGTCTITVSTTLRPLLTLSCSQGGNTMPTTLPMIRAVAGRIYNKSEREIQSAAVGPAAPANGDRDEENQDAFHSSGRGGGFQPPMSPQIDRSVAAIEAGPAVDTVKEQQASIFIFLKIVSTAVCILCYER